MLSMGSDLVTARPKKLAKPYSTRTMEPTWESLFFEQSKGNYKIKMPVEGGMGFGRISLSEEARWFARTTPLPQRERELHLQ